MADLNALADDAGAKEREDLDTMWTANAGSVMKAFQRMANDFESCDLDTREGAEKAKTILGQVAEIADVLGVNLPTVQDIVIQQPQPPAAPKAPKGDEGKGKKKGDSPKAKDSDSGGDGKKGDSPKPDDSDKEDDGKKKGLLARFNQ